MDAALCQDCMRVVHQSAQAYSYVPLPLLAVALYLVLNSLLPKPWRKKNR